MFIFYYSIVKINGFYNDWWSLFVFNIKIIVWFDFLIVFGDVGEKIFVNWCYIVCNKSWVCCGVCIIGFCDVYDVIGNYFIELVVFYF